MPCQEAEAVGLFFQKHLAQVAVAKAYLTGIGNGSGNTCEAAAYCFPNSKFQLRSFQNIEGGQEEMALFESYERRIDKINEVLGSYGIASLEEAEKITKLPSLHWCRDHTQSLHM